MKNRNVGFLIIAVAILIGFIIFSFNNAMTNIVNTSCVHGPSCPMWGTIEFQTSLSIGVMIFVVLIGIYLIFFGKEEKIVTRIRIVRQQIEPKKITKDNYQNIMKDLNKDEKTVLENIINSEGSAFQSELIEKTGFSKVKISRLLDRLEGRGIVEKRRRGMSNMVVLKV